MSYFIRWFQRLATFGTVFSLLDYVESLITSGKSNLVIGLRLADVLLSFVFQFYVWKIYDASQNQLSFVKDGIGWINYGLEKKFLGKKLEMVGFTGFGVHFGTDIFALVFGALT